MPLLPPGLQPAVDQRVVHEPVKRVLERLAGRCVHALAQLLVAHLVLSLEHDDQHGPVEVVGEDLVEALEESGGHLIIGCEYMALGPSPGSVL